MTLVVVRTEAEAQRWPDRQDPVLWLGSKPVPESLRGRAVKVGDDRSVAEGWLEIRRLGDERVGGTTVKQLLEHEGVSLWWFLHHWLLYGKGMAVWDDRYRVLRRVITGVAGEPGSVVLLSRHADDDLVVGAVAATKDLAYRWAVPPWTRWRGRLHLRWGMSALLWARTGKLLMRGLIARAVRKNSLAGRGKADLLFNTTSWTWNARAGTDRVLGPVLEEVQRRGLTIVGLHLDYRRDLGLDSLVRLDGRVVAWESLVTPALVVRSRKRAREIAGALRAGFPGTVLGVPASALLVDRHQALRARLADAILAVETARRALAALRPQCVFVVDAYDLWGLALVVAAREAGTRSVEVQHGLIHPNHSGYLHLEGEVADDHSQRSPFCPMPDLIVVHGEAARSALIEHGRFPRDSIRVTGSPQIEAARRDTAIRSQSRARLGLDQQTLGLLYFGGDAEVNPVDVDHLLAFLGCCRRIAGVRPILRPHPADRSNPKRYLSALRAAGLSAPVETQPNHLEAVIAADIVVAFNSTTVLDAMALERPVIHINMSGRPDLHEFVTEGGAIGVRNEGELYAAILQLSSPEARAALAIRHRSYVRRYFAEHADPAREIVDVGFGQLGAQLAPVEA